jgi:hypothetical protein
LRGEGTELILNGDDFISSLVRGFDSLDMLVRNVVLDIKDLGLLSLASIGASNITKFHKISTIS